MAKKSYTNEAPAGPEPVATPSAPRMVRLVNKGKEILDITLKDGSNVRLAAWVPRGGTRHISEPILRSDAPLVDAAGNATAIAKMARRGEIEIQEA
jgi:hypothetical protein